MWYPWTDQYTVTLYDLSPSKIDLSSFILFCSHFFSSVKFSACLPPLDLPLYCDLIWPFSFQNWLLNSCFSFFLSLAHLLLNNASDTLQPHTCTASDLILLPYLTANSSLVQHLISQFISLVQHPSPPISPCPSLMLILTHIPILIYLPDSPFQTHTSSTLPASLISNFIPSSLLHSYSSKYLHWLTLSNSHFLISPSIPHLFPSLNHPLLTHPHLYHPIPSPPTHEASSSSFMR